MSDGNFFTELAETRRKLWAESDGTLEGYAALCSRIAREAIAEDAAMHPGNQPASKRMPPRRRGERRTMYVCEGDAPGYGEGKTSGFARKGAEGDAV